MRKRWWMVGSVGVGSIVGCAAQAPAEAPPNVAGAAVSAAPSTAVTAAPVASAVQPTPSAASPSASAPSNAPPKPPEIGLLLEPEKLRIDHTHRTVEYDVDYRSRSSRHRICHFDYADWMAKVGDPNGALVDARISVGAARSGSENEPREHFDCTIVSATKSAKS